MSNMHKEILTNNSKKKKKELPRVVVDVCQNSEFLQQCRDDRESTEVRALNALWR